MFNRKAAMLAAPVILLAAFPVAAGAQDASAVLVAVQKAMGGQLPASIHVSGAGSGYQPGKGEQPPAGHFRIESYSQQIDLSQPVVSEKLVRLERPAAGGQPARQTETRQAKVDSPWRDQYLLWTTPYGFLAGALSRSPTVASETLLGAKYQVLTFTAPGGGTVRGYINDQNLIERVRTEFDDPARGKIAYEAVYLDWEAFGALKYPTILIQKQNDQLSRVLIVDKVEATGRRES
jgi:hypothetical protein